MVKKRNKSLSKYYVKYGRSIPDIAKITGRGYTSVHKYLQTPKLRKLLFAEIESKLKKKKKKKKK